MSELVPSPVVDSAVGATGASLPGGGDGGSVPDFVELFRQQGPYAWRLLRRLGVADADAKDVCQEVFVIVHRRLRDITSATSARSFVYGVCVRAAADYRRLARVQRERITDHPPQEMDPFSHDAALDGRRAAAHLREVLAAMDDQKREVFVLFELEELSMAEIADALSCPLQTAYSRLYAARREVKEGFSRRGFLPEVRPR